MLCQQVCKISIIVYYVIVEIDNVVEWFQFSLVCCGVLVDVFNYGVIISGEIQGVGFIIIYICGSNVEESLVVVLCVKGVKICV